jgi:ribonuclease-3
LEARLRVAFRRRELLEQALVHRSYLNENPDFPLASNERLEFFGDAILGYITAEHLFVHYPQLSVGEMTTLRAALVRRDTLAQWARALELGRFMYLGRGEAVSGGRDRPALLAATFEAVVAAIALDADLEAARAFLRRFVAPETQRLLAEESAKDYKSRLQEVVQSLRQITPTYRIVATLGPDHEKTFIVEVLAGADVLGRGSGLSKQAAEQEAAKEALSALGAAGQAK